MLHSPNRTMPAPSRIVPTVVITATGLAKQQDLPSLTGESAEPALAHVPDTLTINQAVQRAIQWLSLIHISEPTRHTNASRMPSSA